MNYSGSDSGELFVYIFLVMLLGDFSLPQENSMKYAKYASFSDKLPTCLIMHVKMIYQFGIVQ